MTKSQKELCFGLGMFLFGLVYFILTMQLPRKGSIDSATVPYFLSSLIMLLGVIHVANNWRNMKRETVARASVVSEGGPGKDCSCAPDAGIRRVDYKTVLLTGVLIFLYVALLAPFGFPLMSSLYLFFQIILLTPSYEKRNYPLFAAISVVASVAVYYTFLWSFDMMLPNGDVWYDLGWI